MARQSRPVLPQDRGLAGAGVAELAGCSPRRRTTAPPLGCRLAVLGWLLVVSCDSTEVGGAERSQRRVRRVTGSVGSVQLMTSGLGTRGRTPWAIQQHCLGVVVNG
jgi:hypothetical protein